MSNKSLEVLKKLLEDPENLTPEQTSELLENSLNFFNEFSELMKNPDKEHQEQVVKDLLNFKERLDEISQKIQEKTGLPIEDLAQTLPLNNFPGFTKEQEQSLREIEKTMSVFGSSISVNPSQKNQNNVQDDKRFPKKNDLHI